MALETTIAKTASDAAGSSLKMAETTVKKTWSILDAAIEKKPPSEYLSQSGIKAMQGLVN